MSDEITRTRPRMPGDGPGSGAAPREVGLYLRMVFSEGRQPLPDALLDDVRWLERGVRLTLGRGDASGAVDPATVALPWDAWASRRHATVSMFFFGDERAVLVEDLASSNGTFLDGAPVVGQVVARVGQILRVGATLFVIGEAPRDEPRQAPAADGWQARSWAMRDVWRRARAIAATDDPALLLGEPGTGKTRLARMIHDASGSADGPFVVMNSSAIPLHLEEATLFGVVAGFIPAVKQKTGLLTLARGGTLFLDELADMPPVAQAKLLDALDPTHRSYLPVGATTRLRTDCRLLCATNRDVFALASRGELRQDLLSRLVVAQLEVPPLRARREDILPIYWQTARAIALDPARAALSVETAEALLLATWTENARGLESLVRRVNHGVTLTPERVREHAERGAAPDTAEPPATPAPTGSTAPRPAPPAPPAPPRWPPTPEELLALLEAHQWNVSAVADAVDMRRETVARALTRTFGPGGKAAAQRALETLRATGCLPVRDGG